MSKRKKPSKALDVETLFIQLTCNAGLCPWDALKKISNDDGREISQLFFDLSTTSQHLILDSLLDERDGHDAVPDPDEVK